MGTQTTKSTIGMILSAGFGSRLKPLTNYRPKPVLELAGKPILYFLIRMMERANINDIVINLHYQPEFIERFIKCYQWQSRIHLVYEPNILGTAGGVRNAFKQLNLDGHAMMVMHGDILCDLDLRSFLQTEDFCTLLCEEGRSIEEYQGNVAINGEGKIIELGKFFYQEDRAIKKGFFTGIQLLSQEALRKLSLCDFESLVAEVYPAWLKQNFLVKAQMQYLEYEDVGSIPRLFHANMAMLKSPTSFQHINILEGLRPFGDAPDIYVGKNVSLDPQVKLVGPAIIADGAVLKSNSVVGPKAIVGERAVISEHVLVKNSVVMSDTIVQKMEQLDCVIALSDARVKV